MIYDISQPVFSCEVYPGDERPEKRAVRRTEAGDLYNLTSFSMCAHNGTHVDAPFHFLPDGKTVDRVKLEKFIGPAFVAGFDGALSADDAAALLLRAGAAGGNAWKRLLLRGDCTVTKEAAEVFAASGMDLLGNESQSVGPVDAPMAVHLILLRAEVVLLEGIRLKNVPDGVYLLHCAPLNLEGADGAPCRATLTDDDFLKNETL